MKYFLILFLLTKFNYAKFCDHERFCQKWNHPLPKPRNIGHEGFAGNFDLELNYVKELTGHLDHNECVIGVPKGANGWFGPNRPWCYVAGSNWSTQVTCDLVQCDEESPNCKDVTTTINGHRCQKWTSTAPHKPNSWMVASLHGKENQVPNHNFCRVADPNDPRPWCYTTNPA